MAMGVMDDEAGVVAREWPGGLEPKEPQTPALYEFPYESSGVLWIRFPMST